MISYEQNLSLNASVCSTTTSISVTLLTQSRLIRIVLPFVQIPLIFEMLSHSYIFRCNECISNAAGIMEKLNVSCAFLHPDIAL